MRIPPEQMYALASQLRSKADMFLDEQQALMSRVDEVRTDWAETKSDAAFGETMADWRAAANEVAESLRESGNHVERAAAEFERLDSEIARA